jgi:uncharacterized membrane protein
MAEFLAKMPLQYLDQREVRLGNIALDVGNGVQARRNAPQIVALKRDDVVGALEAGWRDFKAAPLFGLCFGLLYTLGGWAIFALSFGSGLYYFAYPLATGFALVAPFVAAGVYDVSRRLERGETPTWAGIYETVSGAGTRELGWMALVLTFALIIWLDFAVFLYLMFYGIHMPDFSEFFVEALSTPSGLMFLLVGNAAGALIAFCVFSITVIACPLLLDRDVDFVTAMLTSLRCVRDNFWQMLGWAAIIALWMAVAMVTLMLGLVVILPVFGHATWHLYRKAIAPEA